MTKRPLSPKTPEEIARLAAGGAILRRVLEEVAGMVAPGVTGLALDAEAEKRLRASGAEPSFKHYAPADGTGKRAFPSALCVSVNSAVVHGVPNATPFQEGDLVSVDLGCKYDGLYTDTAMTVPVGRVSGDARRLLAVARRALRAAIALCHPGVKTGDIGAAIQKVADRAGFSVVRDLVGHGVGYAVHEGPAVPNVGTKGTGIALPAGTVIAIEPMVIVGAPAVEVGEDGWSVVTADRSLAAHEEHTVAVTEDGPRVLTTAHDGVMVPVPHAPERSSGRAVLAIDHGDARLGLAVTDGERRHALAHSVVAAVPASRALEDIRRVIRAERVGRILVGLPLTLAGAEGTQAKKVRAFADALRASSGLPVEFVDERFTSRDGERQARRRGDPSLADAEAARLLLQSWLERERRAS